MIELDAKKEFMEVSVSKIKVLLVYIVYPLAMATYFKKALEHRDDVDLKVAGPYTGNWMPWLGGMSVPQKYAIAPDVPLPFSPNVGEINYEIIKAQLGDWVPDIIINVDAGLHFKYKPTDGMVVTVGTDPHVLNVWYDAPRTYSDKFFNMQKVYSKAGDIYLPYAYSQHDFYPEIVQLNDSLFVEQEKDLDAVLIGMPYTHVPRVQWVEALKKHGLKVVLENGPIFDEARHYYARAKIGLNWSSMDDLNCRAFELPAMKIYSVMNRVTDLKDFAFSDHVGIFDDLGGAVDEVLWAMNHPEAAEQEAELAYEAVKGETFDARVEQILKECRFIA